MEDRAFLVLLKVCVLEVQIDLTRVLLNLLALFVNFNILGPILLYISVQSAYFDEFGVFAILWGYVEK